MDASYDAVIAGGGLAGLTLAAHLAVGGWRDRRVLVVDDGRQPVVTRAWSFWSARQGLLDPAVSVSWPRLLLRVGDRRQLLELAPYTYRLVRGADLLRLVDGLLATAPGFTRRQGTVDQVADGAEHATVVVDGSRVTADWVFDSRPPLDDASTRLRFLGWQVETPDPAFDPTAITFMDFRLPQVNGLRFCYLLPTSRRSALVEVAVFGGRYREGGPDDDLAQTLEGYLRDTCGLPGWQLRRRECGDLPLRPPGARRAGRRVLEIGQRGGQVKASTGYAFTRVVRDAEAVTASLLAAGHPFALPRRRRRHAYLDRVLLDVVRSEPESLPEAFTCLFGRSPASRVLRFLDEESSLTDEARLVSSLPPAPFVRAAWHSSRVGRFAHAHRMEQDAGQDPALRRHEEPHGDGRDR